MKQANACDIARDLMPLSVDGVCSEGSQRFLDEHTSECAPCNALYSKMKSADTPGISISPAQEDAALQRSLKRIRWQQRLWLVLAGVVFGSILLGWNLLMAWCPWERPTDIPIDQYQTDLYAQRCTVFIDITGKFDDEAMLNQKTDMQRITLPGAESTQAVIVTISLEYYPHPDHPYAHIFPDDDVIKTLHLGYEYHSSVLHGHDLCLKDGQIYQIASSRENFTAGNRLVLLDPGLPVYEIRITDNTNTKTIYRMGDFVGIRTPYHSNMLREDFEAQQSQ